MGSLPPKKQKTRQVPIQEKGYKGGQIGYEGVNGQALSPAPLFVQ